MGIATHHGPRSNGSGNANPISILAHRIEYTKTFLTTSIVTRSCRDHVGDVVDGSGVKEGFIGDEHDGEKSCDVALKVLGVFDGQYICVSVGEDLELSTIEEG